MKVLFKHLLIVTASLFGFGTDVLGQDYPSRAVKNFVGYPPGGAPDLVARTMGQALSQILGQHFVWKTSLAQAEFSQPSR